MESGGMAYRVALLLLFVLRGLELYSELLDVPSADDRDPP